MLRVPAVPAVTVPDREPRHAAPLPELPATAPATPSAAPEPTWPCTACGASNALQAPACGGCGTGFLAAASSTPKLVLPVVGDLTAMSRSQRVLAAVAVVGVLLIPVALITFLLTGSAPPAPPAGPEVVTSTTP